VTLTLVLGLACAVSWGLPDVWLAQATRSVGPFPTVFGSVLVGILALAPAAPFVDLPHWTLRGVLLAIALGIVSVAAMLFGERPLARQLVGVCLVIAAVSGIAAAGG